MLFNYKLFFSIYHETTLALSTKKCLKVNGFDFRFAVSVFFKSDFPTFKTLKCTHFVVFRPFSGWLANFQSHLW